MPGTPIVDGDYKHAVVQVICLLHEGRYHLVFASAELLPAELSAPPGEALLSAEAPRLGGKARLFFRRYVTTAADALAWYDTCRGGRFAMLQDDAKCHTANEPLFEEPSWPQLITGAKLPVTGDIASSARAHHLYPAAVPALVDRLFKLHPELQQWWVSADAWRQVATALFARYPACFNSHRTGSPYTPQQWLELLGGDELLYGIAVAYLIANGMPLGTIAPAPHQLTELRRRIQAYLGWEGSAGSRTLSVGVVNYLQENVLAASKR